MIQVIAVAEFDSESNLPQPEESKVGGACGGGPYSISGPLCRAFEPQAHSPASSESVEP